MTRLFSRSTLRARRCLPLPCFDTAANSRPELPALIEGTLPFPELALLQSKSYLEQLYSSRHLSAREIARLADVSPSAVLEALDVRVSLRTATGANIPASSPSASTTRTTSS